MNDLSVPTPNIPLLRKAVEWAEAEAAKTDGPCMWDQTYWATATDCGTAYCLAGYTVMTAMPTAEAKRADEWSDLNLYVNGEPALWGETAQAVLGITREERLSLFQGTNTIEDVRLFAEAIAARAGERL